MTQVPDLEQLARAARSEGATRPPVRAPEAESVEFELHYPGHPPMGILAADLVVLDREHRRAAEQIAATRAARPPKRRLSPRRDGLVVKAPREGSFDLGSIPPDAIDAALKNPEAYVNTMGRLMRWTNAKLRRRSPSGETREQDVALPIPPSGTDDRGRVSERTVWRGRWTYPDGTQIDIDYTNEKLG